MNRNASAGDCIVLRGMRFFAYHGLLPEEKANGQRFEVDAELGLSLRAAAESDDMAQGLDYRDVYAAIRRVVEERRFNLLEALAAEIIRTLTQSFALSTLVVRVRKPDVQLGGPLDYAEVQMTWQDEGP